MPKQHLYIRVAHMYNVARTQRIAMTTWKWTLYTEPDGQHTLTHIHTKLHTCTLFLTHAHTYTYCHDLTTHTHTFTH